MLSRLTITLYAIMIMALIVKPVNVWAETINIPVFLDYQQLQLLMIRDQFKGPNNTAQYLLDDDGCTSITFSEPRLSAEGELLRVRESLERGNCDVRLLGIGGGGNKTKPDNWTELKTSDYDLPKLNASLPLHGILGKVKNVVAFGAFVDIGLKTDGLLHIKHFNNRDTSIFAGARIGVDVLGVDVGRGRVELGLAEAGRISGGLGKRKRSE